MNTAELQDKVSELKEELFNLRFQLATGQLENTMVIKGVKRDIARCLDRPSSTGTKERVSIALDTI